VWVRRNQPLQT